MIEHVKFTVKEGKDKCGQKHEEGEEYITFDGNSSKELDQEWLFASSGSSCQIVVEFFEYEADEHTPYKIDCTT